MINMGDMLWGCSVPWGDEYREGCLEYHEAHHDAHGGYHEYPGGKMFCYLSTPQYS